MAKPRDHGIKLKSWLSGEERFDISPYLRTLPNDIDPELAVQAILRLFEHPSTFQFGKACKKLPHSVIRAFLALELDQPHHLFLRLAVDDAKLASTWEAAVQALLDLDLTYAWGSKQRRERFQKLAATPAILAAIQGTVAHSKDPSRDMLAVLVADGGDASLDALVPHLDAALVGQDRRLERLTDLRKHAKQTPALDALFGEIETALETRNAASPALALGPVIGIGHVEPLFFDVWIYASDLSRAIVMIDSRKSPCFHASWWHGKQQIVCEDAANLPAWLAQVEVDCGIQWRYAEMWSSCLRGKKRDMVTRWLLSMSATTRA